MAIVHIAPICYLMVCIFLSCKSILSLSTNPVTSKVFLERRTLWKTACLSVFFGVPRNDFSLQLANAFEATFSSSKEYATASKLALRLEESILKQLPISDRNRNDNTYFPDYMQGVWATKQTLVNISSPLGIEFVGGPNGIASIAEKSLSESRQRLNRPVQLSQRFVATPFGTVEDRLFNTQQRFDRFAGRPVVSSVTYYATKGDTDQLAVSAKSSSDLDPLKTVLVRFRGPAAQKTYVTSHDAGFLNKEKTSWVGYEEQRSIFALTNENTAPPVFTDSEVIWKLDKLDDRHVAGRVRIASYLNAQSDKLYFQAKQRAVSLQDYTLDMYKIE